MESQFIYFSIIRYNYHRLKYQSRELLTPLLAGLESQFIQKLINEAEYLEEGERSRRVLSVEAVGRGG